MISSRLEKIAGEIYSASRSNKYSEKSLSLEERDILNSEGLEVLSFGVGRIVCVHPKDSSKVVKFARNIPNEGRIKEDVMDGANQNKSEIYLWDTASQRTRNFLGKICRYSKDYLIVVMERYEEPRTNIEEGVMNLKKELAEVSGLPINEIREENVAMVGNRYVLIDYGSYEMNP